MVNDFVQYSVKPTSQEQYDAKMPYITSSMMEAVNTCPRWGIIHNVMGKRMVVGYRQMALEAGSLMHDVKAFLNLLHIGVHRNLVDHMHYHGKSLFDDRWDYIWKEATSKTDILTIDDRSAFERGVFAVIGSSEFYDDPNDQNRTVSNIEKCSMVLLDYWMATLVELPIFVQDKTVPEAPIGIEMSLDAVIETEDHSRIRAIGLADVVYQNQETKKITLGEYKTASSMNDAWRDSFRTRHQITLYNALLKAYFGDLVTMNTILIGSAIPVRSRSVPVQHFPVERDHENIQDLIDTIVFASKVIEKYKNNPMRAPMFTHSCNRYFRTCSFMDLCTSAKVDQQIIYEQMEVERAASPSEKKALMRSW